jgi:E3 ubiquitin-protein ligase RNF213
VREKTFPWSVSLRDIKRCQVLIFWFYDELRRKLDISSSCGWRSSDSNSGTHSHECQQYIQNYGDQASLKLRAVVLALSCVYQCRFGTHELRREYARKVTADLDIQSEVMQAYIDFEQKDLLNRLNPSQFIARNLALRENVFLMVVCILTRIPLFVTGNPGQSKTLSINLVL